MAERAGAEWPAAQATVNFIGGGGGGGVMTPPGYGPEGVPYRKSYQLGYMGTIIAPVIDKCSV